MTKVQDQLKQDLAKYFQENNITDTNKGIKDLKSLLTNSVLKSNNIEDESDLVKAWTALQIKNGSSKRINDLIHKVDECILNIAFKQSATSIIEYCCIDVENYWDDALLGKSKKVKSGSHFKLSFHDKVNIKWCVKLTTGDIICNDFTLPNNDTLNSKINCITGIINLTDLLGWQVTYEDKCVYFTTTKSYESVKNIKDEPLVIQEYKIDNKWYSGITEPDVKGD